MIENLIETNADLLLKFLNLRNENINDYGIKHPVLIGEIYEALSGDFLTESYPLLG